MPDSDQQRYHQKLKRVLDTCDCCSSRPADQPTAPADWSERAVEYHERFVADHNDELRWRTCEAARRALARLEQDHFGRCIECGEAITPRRLEAIPWTEYCVNCQEQRERRELPLAA